MQYAICRCCRYYVDYRYRRSRVGSFCDLRRSPQQRAGNVTFYISKKYFPQTRRLSHGLLQSILVAVRHVREAADGCRVVPVLDAGGAVVAVAGSVGVVVLGLDAVVVLHVLEGVSGQAALATLRYSINLQSD